MKIFIGILLTGYHRLPRERLYCNLDEDLLMSFFSNTISGNRLTEINKYIHLADNSMHDKGRMYNVCPLIHLINKKFQQWGTFQERLFSSMKLW